MQALLLFRIVVYLMQPTDANDDDSDTGDDDFDIDEIANQLRPYRYIIYILLYIDEIMVVFGLTKLVQRIIYRYVG